VSKAPMSYIQITEHIFAIFWKDFVDIVSLCCKPSTSISPPSFLHEWRNIWNILRILDTQHYSYKWVLSDIHLSICDLATDGSPISNKLMSLKFTIQKNFNYIVQFIICYINIHDSLYICSNGNCNHSNTD